MMGLVLQAPETASGQMTNRCHLKIVFTISPSYSSPIKRDKQSFEENSHYSNKWGE